MTYIILVAGKGANLQPLTLKQSKTLYKLDSKTTLLQRLIRKIRKYDLDAEIVVVIGFMANAVRKELEMENVIFAQNPFYSVTSSLASLWFAQDYLERENVTIINGDIVMEDRLMADVVCQSTEIPYTLVDSSMLNSGNFNVQVQEDKVCVMSKQLTSFYGKNVGVIKLDPISSRFLRAKISSMINDEMYDQYMENALVSMIFDDDFALFYKDIKDYRWQEVDTVDDLLDAKEIHRDSSK